MLRVLKFQLYVSFAAGAEVGQLQRVKICPSNERKATDCCKCEAGSEPPTKLVTWLETVRRLPFVSWLYKEDRGCRPAIYPGRGKWLMPPRFHCIKSPKQSVSSSEAQCPEN